MKKVYLFLAAVFFMAAGYLPAFSHCDTMDGPVIADAKRAFETNNANYVLKWVRAEDEPEIRKLFDRVMKIRPLSAEAKELAEQYFFDSLVRVHRAGEGVPFTGVKPSGTPINELIKAADKSVETGDLGQLEKMVPNEKLVELRKLFSKAMDLKTFDVNDVKAGREYIEAYVQFFHFAEGEEGHGHGEHAEHLKHVAGPITLILSAVFFLTTVIFGGLYFRSRKN